MAKQQSVTYVKTGEVRLGYVYLTQQRVDEETGEAKYSTMLIIDKSDKATIKAINAAIEAAIVEGISKKWDGKRPKKLTLPLRDADEEGKDGEERQGKLFMNCSRKQKPAVVVKVNGEIQPITDADDIYSGMYGKVSLNFFPYKTKGNMGVGAGLNNVLKTRDGERLAGGTSAATDFEDDEDSELEDLDI